MKFNKKGTSSINTLKIILLIVAILIFCFAVYLIFINNNIKNNENPNNTSEEVQEIIKESSKVEDDFLQEELIESHDSYMAKITLSDEDVKLDGKGASYNNKKITISKPGAYYLSGTSSDLLVEVECSKEDIVYLVLDNVSINCTSTAPINVVSAKEVIITIAENSNNVISDSSNYTTFTDSQNLEPDGTIFSKSDLVINGKGKLVINANYLDGIVSKDKLKIINTNIEINSKDDGIRGKDLVLIKEAKIKINSSSDGIKSTNDTDSELGNVIIYNSDIDIESYNDAIQAYNILNITNSDVNIKTNGEIEAKTNNEMPFNKNRYNETQSTQVDDTVSSKGLKAGSEITINSGNFIINSNDDGIHSNGFVIINDGKFTLESQDDGIHADTNIVINSGNIDITKSYEGIESNYVEINSGVINVISTDDGINISGGNDSSAMMERPGQNNFSNVDDENKKLVINNGTININANGDGLDSNGSININGGNVLVAGPNGTGNGALDYQTSCVVNGGEFAVYGSTEMWQNTSNNSENICLTFFLENSNYGSQNEKVVLKDDKTNEIISSFETVKKYSGILFSSDKITKGNTYSLYINDNLIASLSADSNINQYGNSSNGFGNKNPGMRR